MRKNERTNKKPRMNQKELAESRREAILDKWVPKTELGKKVKSGEIKDIDQVLSSGKRILEAEIIDTLLPTLEYDLITIGQSKGKFGGGKRSIWKQTQKKTKEGNKPKFATVAVIGNKDGYVGIGYGKAKETVPAREKAVRNAKLNIIKVRRGCGSWACGCAEPHSIPIKVSGKCSSVQVSLIPAPKGTHLTVQKELRKILNLAGFKDIYSKTKGQTGTQLNLVKACIEALNKLNSMKVQKDFIKKSGLKEGKLNA
jgi:small subunit ribosomal protein S5